MSKLLRSVMDEHYNIVVTKIDKSNPIPDPARVMLDKDNVYQIQYNDYPDKRVIDILLTHEYGHIYYNHLRIDVVKYLDVINKKLHKRGRACTIDQSMNILNICEDIQINSSLLTLSDLKHMKNANLNPCTAENFNVAPGLRFDKYFDDVIDYLIKKSDEQNKDSDQSADDQLRKLIEQIASDADLLKDCDGTGFSNEITPDGFDDKDFNEDGSDKLELFTSGNSPVDEVNKDEASETGNVVKQINRNSKLFGSNHIRTECVQIPKDSLKDELKRLLLKISSIGKLGRPDSLRIYNRKTRGNTNIIYSSIKVKSDRNKPRVAIVVDVSGSMDRNIVMDVFAQLTKLVGEFNPQSYVLTWDTDLCDKYKITNLPNLVRCGGGTNMASAIPYCKNVLKANKIIFVSDMGTNMESFEYEWKQANLELNLILYDSYRVEQYSKYFRHIIEVK